MMVMQMRYGDTWMAWWRFSVIWCLWWLGALLLLDASLVWADGRADGWQGTVLWVLDGDSLKVEHDGRQVMVRLYGVDAPEYGQPWGEQAKIWTSRQAFGKKVTVLIKDQDQHGRLVATVLLPDGTNLNQLLLSQGLAWWYRHFAPDPVLRAIEAQARQARIGLWSDAKPQPPWVWRRTHKRHSGG